jgi:hypothetical protein
MSDREPDREVIFYYNRERRLERASPAVRALTDQHPLVKGGIIRSLTSTRSNMLLFISILIIMVFIMVFSSLHAPRGVFSFGGNNVKVSVSRGSGLSYVVINRSIAKGKDPYSGVVDIAAAPVLPKEDRAAGEEIPVFRTRIFFTPEPEEEYRFTAPFEAEELMLLLMSEIGRTTVRVKSE